MLKYMNDLFLNNYFLCEATRGKCASESKEIFYKLADIYNIVSDDADKIYQKVTSDEACEIDDMPEYMRHLRLLEYLKLIDYEYDYDEDLEDILATKAEVYHYAIDNGIISKAHDVESVIARNLLVAANKNLIPCMHTVGFMMHEGIMYDKDEKRGMEYLKMAAKWNDPDALLMLLYYGYDEEYCLNALRYIWEAEGHASDYAGFNLEYPRMPKENILGVELIEKLFSDGRYDRKVLNKKCVNIAYSTILSDNTKRSILEMNSNDAIDGIGGLRLPFALRHYDSIDYDLSCIQTLPFHRQALKDSLDCTFKNYDLVRDAGYVPLCISCNSRYIRDMLIDAIKECVHDTIVHELPLTNDGQVSGEFLQNIDENKRNILVLECDANARSEVLAYARKLLLTRCRSNYAISQMYSIDIGAVMPICFITSDSEHAFLKDANIVRIGDFSREECEAIYRNHVENKTKQYGIKAIDINDTMMDKLVKLSIDDVIGWLDYAIMTHRRSGEEIALDVDNIRRCELNAHRYGFGGIINENK